MTRVYLRLLAGCARSCLALLSFAVVGVANGAPIEAVQAHGFERVGDKVWAFMASDDRSANGALFVGSKEALAVDPGLTPEIARRFFAAARAVTDRPIRTVILTHGHPDHALGATCLADAAFTLISTPITRREIAGNMARVREAVADAARDSSERDLLRRCTLRLPEQTIDGQREFDLGGHKVLVSAPGVGHTDGDLVVWSPSARVLASGDLFLNRSSPDMQQGSVIGLLNALDHLLELPVQRVIPGHFEMAGKAELSRYRDYVRALRDAAEAAVAGDADDAVLAAVDGVPKVLAAFADFRQFPQYQATFADNLRAAIRQASERPAQPGENRGFAIARRLSLGRNPHQISFSPDARWAYVAIAGDDRIARVDVASMTPAGAMAIADTPLGVHAIATDELLITRFGAASIERRRWGEPEALASWAVGAGPSLFSGPLPDGSLLASVERADTMVRLQPYQPGLLATLVTGARPFPPGASSDGRLAFVPNYDAGSVTALDLWNGMARAEVAVGEHPSGGVVLPGDIEYAVAVRGENRIAFINTASKSVVASLQQGIGESPFSVVLAPNGRLAFVNNTASHDISVIAVAERRVIARIPVGKVPIVMAVHPSGETLWVSCEGSHEVDIVRIPARWREPSGPEPTASDKLTEVAVLGMIHDQHRRSSRWGLEAVRQVITKLRPDVVIAEIAPDRWERIWTDYAGRGVIEDSRVLRFPEYVDVLLPLKVQLGFAIEPGAAWTQEMSDLRQRRSAVFDTAARFALQHAAYERANAAAMAQDVDHILDSDDPLLIHSDAYDELTRRTLAPYDEYLNDWIGPGGWTNINVAHYRLIDDAIRRHRGERIVITFGAGHKYWILEKLRERDDVRLLDPRELMPVP